MNAMDQKNSYYKGGLASHGHTPVYKMHKYFARRPHNIFYSLIEHYSKEGETIFDPFGGGGVTLIEGLTANRRVISSDINPISSFIQYCQALQVDIKEFIDFSAVLNQLSYEKFHAYFETACVSCQKPAHVRWFEHAYLVECPQCKETTSLKNEDIAKNAIGKNKAGYYKCEKCSHIFPSVNCKRIGSKILSIRYKCDSCDIQSNKEPDKEDLERLNYFTDNYQNLINEFGLIIPNDKIPDYWDRQQEDCLHKKGFHHFKDLFTTRNLIVSAYYFSRLESFKSIISQDLYYFTLFNISSLLRYTNNMNFATSSWMDGRPVAWAKHAYWTPNQFIEVNPIEYFENRIKASIAGLKDQQGRFQNKSKALKTKTFFEEQADYCVICDDSSKIDIKKSSIDAIITDPPYGSNVQYSELCAFWYVWIKDKIPFKSNDFFFSDEAVVHRKTKTSKYSKSFDSYKIKLQEIFTKCYDLLKPNGVLVFTFNNKNIKAWYSVIKAAIDSGFYLDPEGVVYQEPIDAYRDTAHQRFEGTPQGDYIYSFVKESPQKAVEMLPLTLDECINATIEDFVSEDKSFSFDEFIVKLFAKSTHSIIERIVQGETDDSVISSYNSQYILKKINADFRLISTNEFWEPKISLNVNESIEQ